MQNTRRSHRLIEQLEGSEGKEGEEKMAFFAAKALRRTIYEHPWI